MSPSHVVVVMVVVVGSSYCGVDFRVEFQRKVVTEKVFGVSKLNNNAKKFFLYIFFCLRH